MKLAVTTAEPSLDARVDPRFGRCPYFIVVETEDFSFEALENPNLSLGGGAGAGNIPTGFPTPQSHFQELTKEDNLAQLKQQAEAMSQQMRQIQEQIRQLEKEG